jgi:hypothetical protein
MTISYSLAPIPIWVLIDLQGTVAGGGKLYTYNSLDKSLPQAVFQDPGGTKPWPNPIVFNLNGTQGPFYWIVDTDNPQNTYFLQAYDSSGNLLWEVDNFYPTGSGGGSSVTTYVPILNYIANNQFINEIAPTANPIGSSNLVVAPGNHKGFTPALINPIISTYGVVGPDIRFVASTGASTPATDQITFPLFALGSNALSGDVTPVHYVNYLCTNTPIGETFKNFQFPITQKVQNLQNQKMTFGMWCKVTSTPADIAIYLRQYFGSGRATSGDIRTLAGTLSATTSWQFLMFNFTVPTVSGLSIGTPGFQTDDDAVYIQVEMPLNTACEIQFIKPALYLGALNPGQEFDDYDQIDSINSTPRTGDIRVSMTSAAPRGWIGMNDNTIGNTGSGATVGQVGAFTFGLYKTIWDSVSNTYAPVSTVRGASAQADFVAGKTLKLPLSLGRALANFGTGSGLTATVLGQSSGAQSQSITLAAANIPAHTHTTTIPDNGFGGGFSVSSGASPSATSSFVSNGGQSLASVPLTSTPTAFSVPTIQPTSYMNVFIKL